MGERDRPGPRPSAIRVVQRLVDAGHTAYFAGGCVRDELLGLEPHDYDIATDATPDDVAALYPRTRGVGKSFGVMLVGQAGKVVEVATFRDEGPYSDKRRPDHVRFCTPEEDARRRDFTINALFIDPLDDSDRSVGRVIDFVGGQADLNAGLVRAVGDPDERLDEDHLRALRAARFTARLGFRLDEETAGAVRRHARDLEGVSRERIGEELRKMLQHPTRVAAVRLLGDLTLDGPVLAEADRPGERLIHLDGLADPPEREVGFADALAAWMVDRMGPPAGPPAALTAVRAMSAEAVSRGRRSLCLSNEEAAAVRAVIEGLCDLGLDWATWSEAGRMRAGARPWFETALRLLDVRDAAAASGIRSEIAALSTRPGGLAPEPLITGDDLIAIGLTPGPSFACWLDAAYDAQLEGRASTRAAALDLVRSLAGPSG